MEVSSDINCFRDISISVQLEVLAHKALSRPFESISDHQAFCEDVYQNWADTLPRNEDPLISLHDFEIIVQKHWAAKRTESQM
jgi:hypothetical protein